MWPKKPFLAKARDFFCPRMIFLSGSRYFLKCLLTCFLIPSLRQVIPIVHKLAIKSLSPHFTEADASTLSVKKGEHLQPGEWVCLLC